MANERELLATYLQKTGPSRAHSLARDDLGPREVQNSGTDLEQHDKVTLGSADRPMPLPDLDV